MKDSGTGGSAFGGKACGCHLSIYFMKIAIDTRWVQERLSGIGRYTQNLVSGLAGIDKVNEYILIRPSYGIFSFKNQIRLPGLLKKLGVNIYHSTNFMIPLFIPKNIKVVVTIHDLIPFKFPEYTPKAKKTRFYHVFRFIIKRIVQRADRIIAVSKNTARDLHECLKAPKDKIRVVYNGISDDFFKTTECAAELKDYILFVGRADPYKNLISLIRAYAKLLQEYNISNKLVVAGENDPRYPTPLKLVDEMQLKDKVVFLGYVDSTRLAGLYKNAAVFVMPSLYEGFGLPAVEAMACGVPVIVSDTPALKEIVKDNAVIIEPEDINGLADSIYKIITNKGMAVRMAQKAKIHAAGFTITRMAEETVRVYESCLSP